MRFDRASAGLFLALALVASVAVAGPTREDAEACAQGIEHDQPLAPHDSRCVAVEEAFKAQPGAGDLKLSAEALRDWAMILPTTAPARPRAGPDPARLDDILAGLDREQASASLNLWERFRRWVHSFLDARQEQGRAPDWLLRFFDAMRAIPHSAVKALFWFCVAILAASLLWILVTELRASGLFGRPPRQPRRPGASLTAPGATSATAGPVSLDEIARMPAEVRAPALLRWLLNALRDRHLLTPDRALTNGELANRLPAALSGGFRRFIRCIEPALFGGQRMEEATFAQARALADELAGGAARGGTAP